MTTKTYSKPSRGKTANLMVRLDPAGKEAIDRAAALRRVSTSDYVRIVVVAQADRELHEAEDSVIALTPTEQAAFWQALQDPVRLTKRQKELGRIMRGEA